MHEELSQILKNTKFGKKIFVLNKIGQIWLMNA